MLCCSLQAYMYCNFSISAAIWLQPVESLLGAGFREEIMKEGLLIVENK